MASFGVRATATGAAHATADATATAAQILPAPAAPRWLGLLALACCALLPPSLAATRVDLDAGWSFRTDPAETGVADGWFRVEPENLRAVTLPHTWNVGPDHDYFGAAWYFRRLERPPLTPGARVELHFGATFYAARVWMNGVEVGAHEGGYTAWSVDLTPHLKTINRIAVRIDNRPGAATIPGLAQAGGPDAHYDWWTYGGIVRGAWLELSGPARIVRQAVRSTLAINAATVQDKVVVRDSGKGSATRLRVTAIDPQGRTVATSLQELDGSGNEQEVTLALQIPQPQLWNLDQPAIYKVHADLLARDGSTLDTHEATFGLRSVEIRDRHLLLNGERVRLTGMARHEDSPWEGLAETKGTITHDLDDMKALHTTLSRPVHYPQHPALLDYADRHGILLIPEIPVWQFSEAQLADPKVQELAHHQIEEMIEEAGNHPSIFAWSVANESAMATPGGIAYFHALKDWIRKIDPTRYVTFADDKLPKLARAQDSAANDADFLLMNEYYGSWHGAAQELPAALDRVDQLFPDKMVIISELGYAGIFSASPAEADPARIKIPKEQLPQLAARDWIAGVILWCYQDYKSPRNLWPGQREGFVEHGLVDEHRQRKPSYAVWKDLTAPVHLSARWVAAANQAPTGFEITVDSNGLEHLPSRALRERTLEWRVLASDGRVLQEGTRRMPALATSTRIEELIQSANQMAASLTARIIDLDGVEDAQVSRLLIAP